MSDQKENYSAMMKTQTDLRLLQMNMLKAYLKANRKRNSFRATENRIFGEMLTFIKILKENLLKPLGIAGPNARRRTKATKCVDKVKAINDEFYEKIFKLQKEMGKIGKAMDKKLDEKLDVDVPDLDVLKKMSREERKDMIEEWKNINRTLDEIKPVYAAFHAMWDGLKGAFLHEVKCPVDCILEMHNGKAASGKENKYKQ